MQDHNTKSPDKITALILAGGAGERFGGLDKGLELYQGKPLIEYVISSVQPQVNSVLISINRNHHAYQEYGLELVTDANLETHKEQSYQGPMAGIDAAIKQLEYRDTAALLVSTCDSPNLPNDYVLKLAQALDASDSTVAVVHDGQRRQNLHCLIKRDEWSSITRFYKEGNRAMHQWFKLVGVTEVDFSNQADYFSNLNSPDQLR